MTSNYPILASKISDLFILLSSRLPRLCATGLALWEILGGLL